MPESHFPIPCPPCKTLDMQTHFAAPWALICDEECKRLGLGVVEGGDAVLAPLFAPG